MTVGLGKNTNPKRTWLSFFIVSVVALAGNGLMSTTAHAVDWRKSIVNNCLKSCGGDSVCIRAVKALAKHGVYGYLCKKCGCSKNVIDLRKMYATPADRQCVTVPDREGPVCYAKIQSGDYDFLTFDSTDEALEEVDPAIVEDGISGHPIEEISPEDTVDVTPYLKGEIELIPWLAEIHE